MLWASIYNMINHLSSQLVNLFCSFDMADSGVNARRNRRRWRIDFKYTTFLFSFLFLLARLVLFVFFFLLKSALVFYLLFCIPIQLIILEFDAVSNALE